MHFHRFHLFALLVAVLTLIASSAGLTQQSRGPAGGPGSPGGVRGPGGGGFDPNRVFDFMSGGKDTINVADWVAQTAQRRGPQAAEEINAWVQRAGITNGVVTREQFARYMQERMAARGGAGGVPGAPPANATPEQQQAAREEQRAKSRFSVLDVNKDGVLTAAELEPKNDRFDDVRNALHSELDRWDANKNGQIEFDEFKEFYKAYAETRQAQSRNNGVYLAQEQPPAPEKEKAVVYHYGNLPPGLPAWFTQDDTDKDGQIGLYEWKKLGGTVADFEKIDTNGDGFLTVEEVMRYEARKKKEAEQEGTAVARVPSAPSGPGGQAARTGGAGGGRLGRRPGGRGPGGQPAQGGGPRGRRGSRG